MKNITIVAGARPNFMKIAPIIRAIKTLSDLSIRLVHTGQHYDRSMSTTFFDELGIPAPDVNLACSGGSQAEQAGSIMCAFEKELMANPADLVVVVGDVTSTMACAIVAKKLNTKVAHIEAGIRSFDMTMPEEINRIVTDSLTDFFFTTSTTANENLAKIGVNKDKIFFVGNVMIDTLLLNIDRFNCPEIYTNLNLSKDEYIVLTLHRPANVDQDDKLRDFLSAISIGANGLPVLFPVHPRTAQVINRLNLEFPNLHLVEPLGYLEFNYLVQNAKVVITDSGGITEETTVMGVPCMTLRDNTERPETCTIGTNELVGTDPATIKPMMDKLFGGQWKKGSIPELWDGRAAERIVEILKKI